MLTEKVQKSSCIYDCKICDYVTCRKSQYDRHLSTAKHKRLTNSNNKFEKVHECCLCGKQFKQRQGLSRHKHTCNKNEKDDKNEKNEKNENDENDENDDKYELLSNTILMLVKENQDFKQLIIDQNNKMMEMADKIGSNNNNVNSNNKFNLNVFLNEHCKDAMTLKDFVKNIEISMEDFINTGEIGFIEGLSQVMINRINDMDLYERPIHCTDLKRETVYIKDTDKWEKDANKEQLRNAVKGVAYKNERMRPIWYDSVPDVDVLGSDNCEKFLKYSQSALGGCGREETKVFEDKIMRNVLKEVTIDKHLKIE